MVAADRQFEADDGLPAVQQPGEPTTHSMHGSDAKTLIGGSAAAEETVVAGRPFGAYQLLEKLGEGGMGAVYKARHTRLGKIMAVKILPQQALHNPEIVSRFEREMLAVGQVQHPNVVQAHDAGEVNGIHYLAMEFVEGQDLQKLLDTKGRLSVQNACKVIRQASLGLAAAHQRGLVHRDLKPANLFITKGGQIKVLDLGLARLGQEAAGLTSTGECFGTPDYMAPEQWEDAHVCDARTDLYALACTLFCLLTGKPPYGSANYSTAPRKMVGHVRDSIPDLQAARPDVPAELATLYQRLMAKKPEERLQSAQELAQALAPFVKGPGTYEATIPPATAPKIEVAEKPSQPPAAVRTPAPAAVRRVTSRWVLIAAAVVGLAAVAAGILFQIETPEGTIVVSVNQPEIAGAVVTVDGNQKLTIKPGDNQDPIEVTADAKEHTLRVVKGGFETFTQKFTVKAGKAQTIEVTLKPVAKAPPPVPTLSQLEAAKFLLAKRCHLTLKVGDQSRPCELASQLPDGDFQVVTILGQNVAILSDDDVPLLLACPGLEELEIDLKLSPDSFRKLAGLTRLERLLIGATQLDDRQFAAVSGLPSLRNCTVDVSQVTSAELQHFSRLKKIENLTIRGQNFTDNALVHLKPLSNLAAISLEGTSVRGTGLKQLTGLNRLQFIGLNWSLAGNDGLAALAPFKKVQQLEIHDASSITDEGLAGLASMTHLRQIRLQGARISNEGLKHWKPLKYLEDLGLNGALIDDEGLKHLLDLPALRNLWIERTQVGDAGVASLQKMNLVALSLIGTPITDATPRQLKDFKLLEHLALGSPRLTAEGIGELRHVPRLRELTLNGKHYDQQTWEQVATLKQLDSLILNATNIGDAGLAQLAALTNLRQIEVHHTQVTDAGLLHLKDLPRLQIVGSDTSGVTPAGRQALFDLLPSLRGDADRPIATWALEMGGVVFLEQGGQRREIAVGAELPPGNFTLVGVGFGDQSTVNDDNVHELRKATRLKELGVGYTPVTDRGLEWIGEMKQLEQLILWHSKVTGETVKRLGPLTELRGLLLNAVPVGDEAFATVAGLKKLERLHVHGTGLTNRSASVISQLPQLVELCWDGGRLSAQDISQLKALPNLRHIDLNASHFTRDEAVAISQLRLHHLGMTAEQIGPEILEPLAACEILRSLRVQGHFKAGSVAPLARLKSVTHLSVGLSNLGDDDLIHLSDLTQLEGLALAGTKISDKGLPHLEKLTRLQGLDLNNTDVTATGLKQLHSKLPQCFIEGPNNLLLKPQSR